MKFKVPFGQEQLSIYLLLHVLSVKKLHATYVLDNYKKVKDAIFACLQKFYGNATTFPEEHIYSDGPSSEFKNQYMMKLLHHASKQLSAKFTWDYFATGHGKGVVDGIGGEAKSMVRQQVLSKNKNVVAENAADFARVCEEFMPNICVHLMTQDDLIAAQKLNLWENSLEVTGISKTHHAEIKDRVLSIWNHADDAVNAPINSVLQQKITKKRQMQTGDFVKVVKGNFRGYYPVITEESYGDEIEINYFEKRQRYYVLKENDMDSRTQTDLELVEGVLINTRGHYRFEN